MLRNIYEYIKDDEFRFTIFNNRIHIINYVKIVSLNSDFILVESNDRKISIKGEELVLNKMLDKEILVIGRINSIEVLYG